LAKVAKKYELEQPWNTRWLGNFVQQSQIGSLELTLVDFVRHLIAQAAGDECRKFWRRQTYFLALLRYCASFGDGKRIFWQPHEHRKLLAERTQRELKKGQLCISMGGCAKHALAYARKYRIDWDRFLVR
jgi:hypothetical protein